MNGRFLINRSDSKVMGVASGLADYTGVDATLDPPRLRRCDFDHRSRDDPVLRSDWAAGAQAIGAGGFPAGRAGRMILAWPHQKTSIFSASSKRRNAASTARSSSFATAASRATGCGSSFPQLAGLGRSPPRNIYAIRSLEEGRAYLDHPLLGSRLRQSVEALLTGSAKRTAEEISGADRRNQAAIQSHIVRCGRAGRPFHQALLSFFAGPDECTLALLQRSS